MVAPLGQVRRVQLWESVADELRRAILVGELRPGEHLIETELAKRMSVSRGPIREALRQLQLEALVRANPNGRSLVIGLSREGIATLYDARKCLETHALRLAAQRLQPDDTRRLQQLLDQMSAAWRERLPNGLNDLDITFHHELLVLGGNQVLTRLWETLRPQIRTLLEITNFMNPHAQSISDKHQRIVDALTARDGERAAEVLVSHLEEAEKVLVSRMEQVNRVERAQGVENEGMAPAEA